MCILQDLPNSIPSVNPLPVPDVGDVTRVHNQYVTIFFIEELKPKFLESKYLNLDFET